MSYIPLSHFVDKSIPDLPKGHLSADGLTSAMYNPLRSKVIFDERIKLDVRPRDFDYRDYYLICSNERTMRRLSPGNWPLWRKSDDGITLDTTNPLLTYNTSNNYAVVSDYANSARELGIASGYTRSGSFDILGKYTDSKKVYVGLAAVKIKQIRTSGTDNTNETTALGMSGWDRMCIIWPDWYRTVPGLGSGRMVLRCYVFNIHDYGTGHTVFGTAGVNETADIVTSASLNTWLMLQVVHWPEGTTSKVQFRVLGKEFNEGSLPMESEIFSSSPNFDGHSRPATPISPQIYLGYATHAILPGTDVDAVALNAIEWKLFDEEHVCKAYTISGNKLHFSVQGEMAWELFVGGSWTDIAGVIGKRTYVSSGEYDIRTPDFTAIRPVLKNSGLMNADVQSVLNWVEVQQVDDLPTELLTFDDQLNAYIEYRNLPPFPEWWRKQLRLATPEERVRMLRARGITNLPYTTRIFGESESEQFQSSQTRLGLSGNGLYGMSVVQVVRIEWDQTYAYSITTTGAIYIVSENSIELWRRINPETNDVDPSLAAIIRFAAPISNIAPQVLTKELVSISSSEANIHVRSDSLLEIEALVDDFKYIHTSQIDPVWDKEYNGTRRFATDGRGGWLYAEMNTDASVECVEDLTTCSLSQGGKMGHAVFPPKPFNFEKLYGADSYPFFHILYAESDITSVINNKTSWQGTYYMGTVVFWNFIYRSDISPQDGYPDNDLGTYPQWTTQQSHRPYHISSGPYQDYWGYEVRDATYIKNQIAALKQAGYKVITYLGAGQDEWCNQSISDTLDWLQWWVNEFGWDGFYLDGPTYGSEFFFTHRGTWPDAYTFIKELRRIIGDDGIMIFHSSVDPIGNRVGIRSPMILTYGDTQWVGETGELSQVMQSPTDSYLRYFVGDYGVSNTAGAFIPYSQGTCSLGLQEADRAVTGNLHGAAKTYRYYTLPDYTALRTAYAQGILPINVTSPTWWHDIDDAQFSFIAADEIRVKWTTSAATDSEVGWTHYGCTGPYGAPYDWWEPNGLVRNRNYSATLVTSHSMDVELTGMTGTNVKVRVRSTNASTDIWGTEFHLQLNS